LKISGVCAVEGETAKIQKKTVQRRRAKGAEEKFIR
jgi:hypothetical protein